jgi:ABC-type multidrug transport system fused ATPase/permease subunit
MDKINLLFNLKEKKELLILSLFVLFGMLLELLSVGLVLPIIKIFTDDNFLSQVYKFFYINPLEKETLIIYVLSFFLLIFFFKNLFLWIILKKQSYFLSKYQAGLQIKILKNYLKKTIIFFTSKNSSEIINNIVNVTSFFCSVYLSGIIFIILELLILIGLLLVLLYFNFLITISALLIFGCAVLLIFVINKKTLFNIGRLRNELTERQLQSVQQAIGGIKEIKILGKESFFLNNFIYPTNSLSDINYKSSVISGSPRLIIEFLAVLSFSLAVSIFIYNGTSFIDILPLAGLYLAASYKLVPSFNKILFLGNRLKFSAHTANDLVLLLKNCNDNIDFHNQKTKKINFFDEINIENLSFKYPNRDIEILSNLNLKIKKNSFIGIKGESGVGKSTFVDLILGLNMPTKGLIKVDGINIKDAIKSWQNSIGYVSQNIFLISSSIKNNIAFGANDLEIDNDLINRVIDKSSLRNFVNKLKNKENSLIGESGSLLSGGQRQRIGIARALYTKPKLLILDEATSSLDLATEKEILSEIQLLKKDITLIFISHRKEALINCDEIFLLKNGSFLKEL